MCYYDGANLNAIMGHVRPGTWGLTASTSTSTRPSPPPTAAAARAAARWGCKAFLAPFLPTPRGAEGGGELFPVHPRTMGQVRSFYGNFLVVVKALAYLLRLGNTGVAEAAHRGGAQRQLPDEAAGRRV